MPRWKPLSLEEARKRKRLERFALEHPIKGSRTLFDELLDRMIGGKPKRVSGR